MRQLATPGAQRRSRRRRRRLWPGWFWVLLTAVALPLGGKALWRDHAPALSWLPKGEAPMALPAERGVRVYFSPDGGVTDAIITQINDAREGVLVQAYVFTSAPIARALVKAHRRGLRVEVILDQSQRTQQYSSADYLAHGGVTVWMDAQHAIAHDKVILIDRQTVITGSFNFTRSAESRNAENVLILSGVPELAARYHENWERHRSHSSRYNSSRPVNVLP